jgi:hypothetical protein
LLIKEKNIFLVFINHCNGDYFATFSQKNALAGKNVYSFHLPSVFKQGSDVRNREISFDVKYPGDIKIDASWEVDHKDPLVRKLRITLYDQEGNSLVSKKDVSPVHLDYTYTQEHFNKARFLGSTFRIEISKSPFKTINGSVKIITPGKKATPEKDPINTRGPFGTLVEEETEED